MNSFCQRTVARKSSESVTTLAKALDVTHALNSLEQLGIKSSPGPREPPFGRELLSMSRKRQSYEAEQCVHESASPSASLSLSDLHRLRRRGDAKHAIRNAGTGR